MTLVPSGVRSTPLIVFQPPILFPGSEMKKQTYFADKRQPHVKALNAAVDLTGPP
jgi:hypothetical protein